MYTSDIYKTFKIITFLKLLSYRKTFDHLSHKQCNLLSLFSPFSPSIVFYLFFSSHSFAARVSCRCEMTTSSTLLDGGIISQRGSRPAGILIYGYCMTDVSTSKTDEHWLTKHSHSNHRIFHYFFNGELLFAILCNHLLVFYTC